VSFAGEAALDPRNGGDAVRRRLEGWLALQQVGALRPQEAVECLAACAGDPWAAARRMAAGERRLPDRARLREAVEVLARAGALAVPLGSPDYPPRVAHCDDAAPLLLVRGDPAVLRAPAVALVGARRCSERGRETARALAANLAQRGVVVLSGLARGIDAAAHRGALAAHGPSVGVLGCGIDVAYPRSHRSLIRELAQRGAVLSELPPGAPPLRYHFPLRNRLIAALARVVVVVEGRAQSGSLITARLAGARGDTALLAVPGPVDEPVCAGSNALLRDGVAPCLEADDVVQALGLPRGPRPGGDPLAGVGEPGPRAALRALLEGPATPDELARRLGRSAAALAVDVVQLELAGRVVREPDGRLRARPARGLS
jgi:DNA processing protein